jgi:hypothetical protein
MLMKNIDDDMKYLNLGLCQFYDQIVIITH